MTTWGMDVEFFLDSFCWESASSTTCCIELKLRLIGSDVTDAFFTSKLLRLAMLIRLFLVDPFLLKFFLTLLECLEIFPYEDWESSTWLNELKFSWVWGIIEVFTLILLWTWLRFFKLLSSRTEGSFTTMNYSFESSSSWSSCFTFGSSRSFSFFSSLFSSRLL